MYYAKRVVVPISHRSNFNNLKYDAALISKVFTSQVMSKKNAIFRTLFNRELIAHHNILVCRLTKDLHSSYENQLKIRA